MMIIIWAKKERKKERKKEKKNIKQRYWQLRIFRKKVKWKSREKIDRLTEDGDWMNVMCTSKLHSSQQEMTLPCQNEIK